MLLWRFMKILKNILFMSLSKCYFRVVYDDINLDEVSVDELQELIDFFVDERSKYQELIKVYNVRFPQLSNVIVRRLHVIEHELNNLCLILKYRKHYEYCTPYQSFR